LNTQSVAIALIGTKLGQNAKKVVGGGVVGEIISFRLSSIPGWFVFCESGWYDGNRRNGPFTIFGDAYADPIVLNEVFNIDFGGFIEEIHIRLFIFVLFSDMSD
jgi:hypothetical protein